MTPFQAAASSLPLEVRAMLQQRYGNSPITVLALPIWSTARFQASVAGVIDVSTRRAFGYGIGQSATPGGFLAAYGNATNAETNLKTGTQTNNGADVLVYGIAAHLTSDSEPALAARVWRETYCELAVGANTTIPLGMLEMIPGAGGLRGIGQSALKQPAIASPGYVDGGAGAPYGFVENGESAAPNYYRLSQPIVWSGVANGVDSSFQILCTPQRQITEAPGAARAAAAGVAAFTPPAAQGDRGTYVDVRFRLIALSISRRSNNT